MSRASWGLLTSALGLLVLGLWSLSSAIMLDHKGAGLLYRQLAAAGGGLVLFTFLAWLDYRRLNNRYFIGLIYAATLVLLVLVYFKGQDSNGARRWVFGVQPSEFAKLVLILSLAWFAAEYRHRLGSWKHVALGAGGIVVPMLLAILIEPDRGTTVLLAVLCAYLLLVAGVPFWMMASGGLVGAAMLATFLARDPLVRARFGAWKETGAQVSARGEQNRQAILAFGEGGWIGKGLGAGTMMRTIPERNTDFILPVIGEELGLAGTLSVTAAFGCILLCGSLIARRAALAGETFGLVIAAGVTFLITLQAWANIAVVTQLIPNKGIALPFVSRGGSNLVIMFSMLGLLLGIDRHTPRDELSTRRRLSRKPSNPFGATSDDLAFSGNQSSPFKP